MHFDSSKRWLMHLISKRCYFKNCSYPLFSNPDLHDLRRRRSTLSHFSQSLKSLFLGSSPLSSPAGSRKSSLNRVSNFEGVEEEEGMLAQHRNWNKFDPIFRLCRPVKNHEVQTYAVDFYLDERTQVWRWGGFDHSLLKTTRFVFGSLSTLGASSFLVQSIPWNLFEIVLTHLINLFQCRVSPEKER